MEELATKIGELLESKDVGILDDYYQNIFYKGDSISNELFRIKHPRFIKNDEENKKVANKIIKKLNKL